MAVCHEICGFGGGKCVEGGVNRGWSMATEGGENSVQDLKKLWRADLVCVKGCEGVVRCGRVYFAAVAVEVHSLRGKQELS